MQQENKHKGQVASTRPSLRRSLEVRIRGRSTRVPPPPRHRACALARVCGPKRRRGVCVWYVEGVCLCASGKGTFGSNNSSKQRPLPTPRLTGSTPWRGAHACAAHTYPTTTSFTVSMKVNWSTAAACVPLKGEENSKTPSRNIFINRYIVQFKPCEVRSNSLEFAVAGEGRQRLDGVGRQGGCYRGRRGHYRPCLTLSSSWPSLLRPAGCSGWGTASSSPLPLLRPHSQTL